MTDKHKQLIDNFLSWANRGSMKITVPDDYSLFETDYNYMLPLIVLVRNWLGTMTATRIDPERKFEKAIDRLNAAIFNNMGGDTKLFLFATIIECITVLTPSTD